jgi:hypothetical protein
MVTRHVPELKTRVCPPAPGTPQLETLIVIARGPLVPEVPSVPWTGTVAFVAGARFVGKGSKLRSTGPTRQTGSPFWPGSAMVVIPKPGVGRMSPPSPKPPEIEPVYIRVSAIAGRAIRRHAARATQSDAAEQGVDRCMSRFLRVVLHSNRTAPQARYARGGLYGHPIIRVNAKNSGSSPLILNYPEGILPAN